jgi:uncharacterized protein YndB with AHSA1/START domain
MSKSEPKSQTTGSEPTRRSIEVDIEVPGTPEQVWQAIATGPGISSWFVPTEVAEREGGAIRFLLGPGMESAAVVTAWEPPGRFEFEERDWAPGAPPLATEIRVEARSGGTCVVRLVNSLFASTDDWDDQLKSFETGWTAVLYILRLYLTYFPGQRCASMRVMGTAAGSVDEGWAALKGALGLATDKGARWQPAGVPAIAGVIERADKGRECVLLLDEPAPGFALVGAYSWSGQTHTILSLYLFGDQPRDVVAREEPAWRSWMEAHFPSAPGTPEPASA